MTTKAITAGAVLVAVSLSGLFFIAAHRPSSPITVRHIKSVQTVTGPRTTFEISNHTASPYALQPVEVEALDGQEWRRCFFFVEQLSSPSVITPWRDVVAPHGSVSRVFELTNLPTDIPLRLQFLSCRELTGVGGFWERLRERYWEHVSYMSLNPSDKHTFVFERKVTQITSEEFIEPKR